MLRLLFLIVYLFVVSVSGILAAGGELPTDTEKLLRIVDDELDKSGRFAAHRYIKADSITQLLDEGAEGQERLCLLMSLGRVIENLSSDSALVIYAKGLQEAKELNDTLWMERFLIRNALQLHALGLDGESLCTLDFIRRRGMHNDNREDYSEAEIVVNCGLYDLHPKSARREQYIKRAIGYAEDIISGATEDERQSVRYKLCQAFLAREEDNKALLSAILNDVVETVPVEEWPYSAAAMMLGDYYKSTGQRDEAIRAYAMGAISDIRNANYHGRSIIFLARELYDKGDISRAYNYLTNALDFSLKVGSKFNQMELSDALKPVSDDYRRVENRRMIIIGAMTLVLLVALDFILRILFSLRNEKKILRQTNQKLAAANEAKELYIGQYLSLCSTFLEQLEDFARTCRRKITAGQVEDLLSFIKSGKTLEQQRAAFYDIFDDTFIHIYPTFVKDVNALLQPDKQIVITGASQLIPELRILAFQRLGIDDTAKVARFLGLSMNTIYTYRNKLRSRAKDRDTFDRDVMNIGIIS